MTIEELKKSGWIIMDAIVGSQSFGLATETSDIDTRGVFIIPMNQRISYGYFDQVADAENNHVYWELGKFIELLNKANPTSLEFLNSADKNILAGKEWFEYFRQYDWLSMTCRATFVKYAEGQLSRAYGLNKKVFSPQPKEPPEVLDFCYILGDAGAIPAKEWISKQACTDQKWYTLAAVDHFDMGYRVYCQSPEYRGSGPEHTWRWAYGIVSDEKKANDVQLHSIPKGIQPVAFMTFNRNAYSKACKTHTEYWEWVRVRNEARYENTVQQGKGYDAKNVMHCIRLLMTARDIAEHHVVTVDRTSDRQYLLSIKNGEYGYDEIIQIGNDLIAEVNAKFDKTKLKASGFSSEELDKILREALLWSRKKENWMIV